MSPITTNPLDLPRRGKVPDAVLEVILEALRGVQYGQVTINVQDGQVVQVDRLERRRLKT